MLSKMNIASKEAGDNLTHQEVNEIVGTFNAGVDKLGDVSTIKNITFEDYQALERTGSLNESIRYRIVENVLA